MNPNQRNSNNVPQAQPSPRNYPSSAQDFLGSAASTLGERGKQYDPAGKQERSMTAIVAAFNAIYPRNPLTVHMGWQFMSLVKMVRGATKPHADSALDQVAYAALAAEEVASQFVQPAPTPAEQHAADIAKVMEFAGLGTVPTTAGYARVPVRVAHTIAQVAELERTNRVLAEELGKCQHWAGVQSQELKHLEAKAMAAHEAYMQALEHNRSLEVQLDTTHSALADFVCRFDLTKEYMTKEQVLAGQFKHNEQVANLRQTVKAQAERECLDIETINNLKRELADKNALLKDVEIERNNWQNCLERAESKVQDIADLAEYRDKRNAELCAELETQRGKCIAQSSRISELQTLVDNLRSSLAQATKEAPCAHNTDEPKAPRPEFVDPFDQYGDIRSPMHRLVGDRDPARGGLAYPQGKDAPTPL